MKLAFKFGDGRIISHEVFERTFSIGRSENCRVTIPSDHFSREHCLIELVDGVIYVTDLESKNGVFMNHVRLPKKQRAAYDLLLPLYVGECFLTIDIKEDMKDADHLSLETYSKIDFDGGHQHFSPLRRVALRRPQPRFQAKGMFDSKSFLIVILVVAGIVVIHRYREPVHARIPKSEKSK